MRRFVSMKKIAAIVAVTLVVMTLSLAGAQAAPSGSTDIEPQFWGDCRSGFSCYFANAGGETPMWVAPSHRGC